MVEFYKNAIKNSEEQERKIREKEDRGSQYSGNSSQNIGDSRCSTPILKLRDFNE